MWVRVPPRAKTVVYLAQKARYKKTTVKWYILFIFFFYFFYWYWNFMELYLLFLLVLEFNQVGGDDNSWKKNVCLITLIWGQGLCFKRLTTVDAN